MGAFNTQTHKLPTSICLLDVYIMVGTHILRSFRESIQLQTQFHPLNLSL